MISRAMISRLLLASTLLVPAALPASAEVSLGSKAYDGKWSVVVVTQQGTCDKAYRYALTIDGGKIGYGGEADFTATGGVTRDGRVDVSIRRGDQSADGRGRLTAKTGSGTWTSASGGCSGTWKAERRG